ncbi:MAG TPA: hypothetical protein VHO03_12110 [Ignavibacteriales bacterium]|nr:hypothetical protein [Ignavibacteriales bacterium]
MEPEPEFKNGLTGRVVDSSGVALDSVSIYCYYSFYPSSLDLGYEVSLPKKLNKKANFDFAFFRNYPNPVYNSTYIKFSIPGKSQIAISIKRVSGIKALYAYSGIYDGGLYQYYLKNIVDSLKLMNGPYTISFSAASDSGRQFNSSCSMFVISDRGTPNTATNSMGEYYFPYSEAFIGDSIITSSSDYVDHYARIIENYVCLYVKRRGYKPQVMQIALYRNLLLHQDIVLYKEDKYE